MRTLLTRWVCLIRLGLGLTGTAAATETYLGFTIDDSAVHQLANREALLTATREQIDIVHAVGLPADILTFAQSIKFELVPVGTFKSQTPGRYLGQNGQRVQVSAAIMTTGHKPILLHELMHAYHDQRVEGGFRNQAIIGYYKSAKPLSVYAAKSHMMENEREFFACAATAYLFGVTAQEPFRREKLQEKQPDYYVYLKKLFGPAAGCYGGSLTR